MLKNFLVFVVVIGTMLGVSKFVMHKIETASQDSAGDVEVVKKAPVEANTKELVTVQPVPFETETRNVATLAPGVKSVAQEGVAGEKTVIYTVTYDKSGKETARKVTFEQQTKKPVKEIVLNGTGPRR